MRNRFIQPFVDHPATVGESYGQHFRHATGFGLRMMLGGLACVIHGILPFLFVRTGSAQITSLHKQMVVDRGRPLPAVMDFVI